MHGSFLDYTLEATPRPLTLVLFSTSIFATSYSGTIRPIGVLSRGFSTRLAYASRLDPITRTRSKTCEPLNVSAHSRITAAASCLSRVLSPAMASMLADCPAAGPPREGSIGTANSVSSSIRRTISSKFFSSTDTTASLGPIKDRVNSHLDSRTAHSKLHTIDHVS